MNSMHNGKMKKTIPSRIIIKLLRGGEMNILKAARGEKENKKAHYRQIKVRLTVGCQKQCKTKMSTLVWRFLLLTLPFLTLLQTVFGAPHYNFPRLEVEAPHLASASMMWMGPRFSCGVWLDYSVNYLKRSIFLGCSFPDPFYCLHPLTFLDYWFLQLQVWEI